MAEEQASIARRLPDYLDDVREDGHRASGSGARALHDDIVAA
jgi:hypothetical protein